MFCPKCGEKLQDGTRFCGACGAEITSEATQAMETAAPEAVSGEKMVSHKKKTLSLPIDGMSKNKLIGIAAVAAVIVIAIFAIGGLSSGSGSSNAYAYLSDGNYGVVTNIKKGDTVEVSSSRNSEVDDMGNFLKFSSDGKYIYYLTKFDNYNSTGSLYRAEYGKLKEGSSKNDNYITVIDTDVSTGFETLEENSVLYIKDGDLYYHNGKESTRVARDVTRFNSDGQKNLMYYTGTYEEGYTLYSLSLDDVENKTKIASNIRISKTTSILEDFIYFKQDGGEYQTLYTVSFGEEPQKLGEGVDFVEHHNGKTYFTANSGVNLTLTNYVNDEYIESDADKSEPKEEDFYSTKYDYDSIIIYSWESEEDYPLGTIYTSCTREVAWTRLRGPGSSLKDLDESWYSNSSSTLSRADYDELKALATAFVDKYSSLENEDGYFLVTEEIKQDLMAMNNIITDYDEVLWLRMCFERTESEEFNGAAYQAQVVAWEDVSERNEMREYLKNDTNGYPVKNLYMYENGTVTTLAENVLNAHEFEGGIMYNAVDMITEKVDIDDIIDGRTVESVFDISAYAQNYILLLEDNTICQMSEKAAETYGETYEKYEDTVLYFSGGEAFMGYNNRDTLSVSQISNGIVGDFSNIISDDASIICINDGKIYYETNYYGVDGVTYCDIYTYENGSATVVVPDVVRDSIRLYDDGSKHAITNVRSGSGTEITIFDKNGNGNIIGEDITMFMRPDETTALYISDGDLYFYNGKKSSLIKSDVDYFWCKNVYRATW